MIGRHYAVQKYLKAVLNLVYRHKEYLCADTEYSVPFDWAVAGNEDRWIDVALVQTDSADSRYMELDRCPPYGYTVDGCKGVAFEVKVSRNLRRGVVHRYEATEQLLDYRLAGFVPVLVAPQKVLEKEWENVRLKKFVRWINGACLEFQLSPPGSDAETTTERILRYNPIFKPGKHFADRVDRQLDLDPALSEIFSHHAGVDGSDYWQRVLWQEAVRSELTQTLS